MPFASIIEESVRGDVSPSPNFDFKRGALRRVAILPLAVQSNGETSVGLLRDISSSGLFFFAKLNPVIGTELLIFTSAVDQSLRMCCRCRVVRIEPAVAGAATGIGVTIEGYVQ